MAVLRHHSLGATLKGLTVVEGEVCQFRGLQYASIPSRFARPAAPPALSGVVECTLYGPRCPQNYVDFRHLLRIPEAIEVQEAPEDEFGCLNLDITLPARPTGQPLEQLCPVLLWIHGGSQTITFGSSASKLCDPTNLVRISAQKKQPIVVVTINYRLNIFAFGDGNGEKNLALLDQRAAVEFVKQHIGDFGGDPQNITLAGESAGAVYAHAHMVMGTPIRQCILQSGSLYLSPPQRETVAMAVIDRIENLLARKGNWTLRNAPVVELINAQAELGIVSLFLQEEPDFRNWQGRSGDAERLLIGDCEYESAFMRNGIEALTAESISQAFDLLGDKSAHLKALYGIVPSRPSSSKTGALDFLNDVRFTFATEHMVSQWRNDGKHVFRYLVDQSNPWQSSSRAHHAVDLPLLFGGFDLSFNSGAERVASQMSHKWINFVNGLDPWHPWTYFAFGPLGESGPIDEEGFAARRRKTHCDAIKECGVKNADVVWKILAAGNISLEN